MPVKVKIPAQLRPATGGEGEIEVEAGDGRRRARRRLREARRPAGADHRGRRSAPLRERLRLRRGHPLPGRPRDDDRRRRRGDDPARGRRRLSAGAGVPERAESRRDPLRGSRHAAAGAHPRDPEGAGRDRRTADRLARHPDLCGARLPPVPAADRLPRRDDRGLRRRRALARRRHRRVPADTGDETPTGGRVARAADRLGRGHLRADLRRRRRRRRSRRGARLPPRPRHRGDGDARPPALAMGRRDARRRRPDQRLRREAADGAVGQRRVLLPRAGGARLPGGGLGPRARSRSSGSPPTGSCTGSGTRASGTAWTPTRTRCCSTTSGSRGRRRGGSGSTAAVR